MIVMALLTFLKIWQRCLMVMLHKNMIYFVYYDLSSHATSSFAFYHVCGPYCSFLISTIMTGIAQSKNTATYLTRFYDTVLFYAVIKLRFIFVLDTSGYVIILIIMIDMTH